MGKFAGPWRIVEREVLEDGSVYPRHVVCADRDLEVCALESCFVAEKIVAEPDSFWKHSPRAESSHRLIAAAPEMADELLMSANVMDEVCTMLRDRGDSAHAAELAERIRAIRAILAKAI